MRLLLIPGLLLLSAAPAAAQEEVDYSALSISGPEEVEAGADVQLSLTVGSRDLSPVSYAIVFRANIDESTVVSTGQLSFSAEVETQALTVTIPSSLSGRQTVELRLDPSNAIVESNEFDNEVEGKAPIRVLPSLGDLAIQDVDGPMGRLTLGTQLSAEVQIQNLGTERVRGNLRAVLSRGLRPSGEDTEVSSQFVELAPGESEVVTLSGLVPLDSGTGERRVGAVFFPEGGADRDRLNDAAVDETPVTLVANTLNWLTEDLHRAVLGFSYAAIFEAAGGDGSFSYSVVDGALPDGLELSLGALSGVPEESGSFSFTVELASDGRTITQVFELEVAAVDEELLIVTSALPRGRLQSAYAQRLIVAGGEPPYVWSLVEGDLPAGIMLSEDGRLDGTPAEVGLFDLRLQVEDRNGEIDEIELELRVETSATILVDPEPLPLATAGEPYSTTLEVTGGNPPYQWTLGVAPLPPGLTLSSNGLLDGRPNLTGAFVFQVDVRDSSSPPLTDRSLVFLTVEDDENFTIQTPSPEPVLFRNRFERVFTAEGGVAPYSWTLVPGTVLPSNTVFSNGDAEDGLEDAGVLRGAPTAVGTYGLGVRVEDGAGRRREVASVLAVQRSDPADSDGGGCRQSGSAWAGLLLLIPFLAWRRRRS